MTFGTLYAYEQKNRLSYRQNDEMLAYAGLCGYLTESAALLDHMTTASPAELVMLAQSFHALSGGARAVTVSLPVQRSSRERLNGYFGVAEAYLNDLTARLLAGELPDKSDLEAVKALRDYVRLTSERMDSFCGEDYDGIIKGLEHILIDTPPVILKSAEPSDLNINGVSVVKRSSALLAVTNGQAKETAMRYLGRYSNLRRAEKGNNIIRFYNGSAFIDILRYGGDVMRISVGREISRLLIDGSEARRRAELFLSSTQLSGAAAVSEKIVQGRMDFKYYLDGAYITVGVALDNGKIVLYDASRYYNR